MKLSDVKIGVHENIAILFSDIRNFTKLTEDIPIEKVMELLRIYFDEMASVIVANNGVVGTFVGDALVGYFGFEDSKNAIDNAARPALEIKEQSKFTNIGREIPILNGIGLDNGIIDIGTVHSNEKICQTVVIGSPINRASRFERLTRASCHRIIMPKTFYDNLSSELKNYFVDIGRVEVRGMSELVHIYGDDPVKKEVI